jgi:DNA-binding MarR family transcriptional regulator
MPGIFDRLQAELESRERVEGINAADLLDLSPELRRTIQLIMRRKQMSLTEIILELDMKPSEVKKLLDTLVEKGYLKSFEVEGEPHYKTFLARKRGREVPLNIWEALSDKTK